MLENEMNDDIEDDVMDLITQLKQDQKVVRETIKTEEFKLDKDNLEEFIINKTGFLINSSIDMVNIVKQYVEAAPNSEEVESLASLLRAATGSIDSLSKILIQDKKTTAGFAMKQLDIDSKKELLHVDHQNKIELSREEVLAQLISGAELIEAEVSDTTTSGDHDRS